MKTHPHTDAARASELPMIPLVFLKTPEQAWQPVTLAREYALSKHRASEPDWAGHTLLTAVVHARCRDEHTRIPTRIELASRKFDAQGYIDSGYDLRRAVDALDGRESGELKLTERDINAILSLIPHHPERSDER